MQNAKLVNVRFQRGVFLCLCRFLACIDIINQQKVTAKNDPTDLLKRIDKQHGTHTIDHAAQIGLGSKKYELVNLDL